MGTPGMEGERELTPQQKGDEERIRKQITRFDALAKYAGKDRVVIWPEYLENRQIHFGKTIKFSSGFQQMDSLLDGFQTGELVTISGHTANGKTLFLKSMVRSFGIGEVPVAVFSYEDAVERYLRKFEEEGRMYPIYVPMELKTGDLAWLENRAVEAKVKHGVRVITIDHLHYLIDMNAGQENMSLRMGSIMRFLKKRIAEEHNMLVFIIAHQRGAEDHHAEASLETIRDSALIANESDHVFIVQRMPDRKFKKHEEPTYDLNLALVKIEKSRREGVFRKRLPFQKRGNWLEPSTFL